MSEKLFTKEQKEAADAFKWTGAEKRDLFPILVDAIDSQKEAERKKHDKYNNSKVSNDEKRAQWLYSYGYDYGKPEIRWMTPEEFLNAVPPVFSKPDGRRPTFDENLEELFISDYAKGMLESVKKTGLNEGDYLQDMPWYDVDDEGNVQNHEGRHRAAVAHKLGIPKIKVAVFLTKFKELPRHEWEAMEMRENPETMKIYINKRAEAMGYKTSNLKGLDLSKPVKVDPYVRQGKLVRRHSRKKPKI